MKDYTLSILRRIKYKKILLKLIKRELTLRKNKIKEYPETIQLPITYKCNFDCVMCGMHHMTNRKDFSPQEIKTILKDKLYQNVIGVGVNGGEPFLRADLPECIDAIVSSLPQIKELFFISNGFFSTRIIEHLEKIKKIVEKKHVRVNLALSVDGINDMQDFHRGAKNAFNNIEETVKRIKEHEKTDKIVDDLTCICTITKYNIFRITEVENWAAIQGLQVVYNIATVNVRIENEEKLNDFSVFSDEKARHLAMEFFYKKYMETDSERYFGLYLFLRDKKRYTDCPCMHNEWITLTPDSQVGFCATHSKYLGSALEKSSYQIVQDNMEYLKELKRQFCETCSHYMYKLNKQGLIELYHDKMRRTVY